MRPTQALKSRIRKYTKQGEEEKRPSLLDILRKRNRDLEVREQRRVLLRRVGKP